MNGHLAQQCPKKSSAPGSGNQARPQGQQNYNYDKVNHVMTEEAQQAQDIELGMFLASSHPATVLFDSEASHSFVSSTFVVKHHIPITIVKHTMLVSSPGGEMRTKHICPTVSINIRGLDFLVNLIILDSYEPPLLHKPRHRTTKSSVPRPSYYSEEDHQSPPPLSKPFLEPKLHQRAPSPSPLVNRATSSSPATRGPFSAA
jgi:hypothetical protein